MGAKFPGLPCAAERAPVPRSMTKSPPSGTPRANRARALRARDLVQMCAVACLTVGLSPRSVLLLPGKRGELSAELFWPELSSGDKRPSSTNSAPGSRSPVRSRCRLASHDVKQLRARARLHTSRRLFLAERGSASSYRCPPPPKLVGEALAQHGRAQAHETPCVARSCTDAAQRRLHRSLRSGEPDINQNGSLKPMADSSRRLLPMRCWLAAAILLTASLKPLQLGLQPFGSSANSCDRC